MREDEGRDGLERGRIDNLIVSAFFISFAIVVLS